MDNINVGRSSKGRRIIPPLTYWTGKIWRFNFYIYIYKIIKILKNIITKKYLFIFISLPLLGERIIMKDNNPVYKPGTIQDNNNRINNSLEVLKLLIILN